MPHRRVEFDANTVRVFTDAQALWRVLWAQIDKIIAYKADLFAVDLIVIQLIDSPADIGYEVDEEMDNYKEFLASLPSHFPGIREDWWREVAFPAFETHATELWSRKT